MTNPEAGPLGTETIEEMAVNALWKSLEFPSNPVQYKMNGERIMIAKLDTSIGIYKAKNPEKDMKYDPL